MSDNKKNILVVTPYPLLPANSGGRLYVLSTIKPLCEEYNFHLLALANPAEYEELEKDRSALMEQYHTIFRSVHFEDRPLIPHQLGSKTKILKYFLLHTILGLPLMDVSYYNPKAVRTAKEIIKRCHIDLLEVQHLHAACYRRFIRDIPAVLVNHNIESELWPFWSLQNGPRLAKKAWDFFGRRSRSNAYDIEILNKYGFAAKTFISTLDMAKVEGRECPLYFLPMNIPLDQSPKEFSPDVFRMLWIGGFFWHPNIDAVVWFMKEIWPLIKKNSSMPLEVHFVGSDPPKALSEMHDGREIFVHGYVKEVGGFREKADAFIVPLRAGGGVRIKIIEALNAGIPVVSTSKGCEGLPVENSRNIMIADTPHDFVKGVLGLAESIELRRRMSGEGRRYCAEYHSPEKTAEIKRAVYNVAFEK